MKILQPFLDLKALAERAVAHAHKIVERWDVPHEVVIDGKTVPVPADLDDRTPRMWGLADGRRITSVLTLDELATGGSNPAIPLLLALIPLSTLLLFVNLYLSAFVWLVAVIFAWRVAGFKLTAVAGILASLPFYGMMFVGGGYGYLRPGVHSTASFGGIHVVQSAPDAGAWGAGSLLAWFGALATTTLWWVLLLTFFIVVLVIIVRAVARRNDPAPSQQAQYQPRRSGLVHTGKLALLLIAVVLGSLFASAYLPICAYIPMVVFPAWYVRRERAAYLRQLAAMDNLFPGESLNKSNSHVAARKEQAANAVQDHSPFITLGTATGTLTKELDGYAPDAGMPVGLTIEDLSQHLLVIGKTGTRKTSTLRNFIAQYVAARVGGGLFGDGKASLPMEMKGLPGYTIIDSSVDIGLLDGLDPTGAAMALSTVGGNFKNSKGQENAKFFRSSGYTMLFYGFVLCKALIEAGVDGYAWDLASSLKVLSDLNTDPTHEGDRLLGLLGDFTPADKNDAVLLAKALTFAVSTISASEYGKTRLDVWATVQSWTDPLLLHPELARYAYISNGVDISKIDTDCGLFGMAFPKVKYGEAGLLLQSLLKERVYSILRRRAIDQKPNQKKILILIDEAQELIGDADEAFLPVARGLGGIAVFASQSIDAFRARIGDKDHANAFLDAFLSQVILRSSEASQKWIATQLGTTVRPTWQGPSAAIGYVASLDSLATASLSAVAHEGTSLYRSLRRQGAGQFMYGNLYGRDYGHVDDLHIQAMTAVKFEEKPLITLAEADQHLAEPSVAIVQVQRGGVRRRDFVKLSTLKSFSPAKAA